MINLSYTLTDDRVWRCVAVTPARTFEPAFTHPFDAELADDTQAYRDWLLAQLDHQTSQTYKHAKQLALHHLLGDTVVLRVHQNALHGDVLRAALLSMAATLHGQQPAPTSHQRTHAGLDMVDEMIEEQATEIDYRRFVWITGKDGCAHLGYIWDTEAVITALTRDHGLVKLGRLPTERLFGINGDLIPVGQEAAYRDYVAELRNVGLVSYTETKQMQTRTYPASFWAQRHLIELTPRVRVAAITDIGENEATFEAMITRQRNAEEFINERTANHNPNRYDDAQRGYWQPVDEPEIEPEISELEQLHEDEFKAFMAFHATFGTNLGAYHFTKYDVSFVRPVIRTGQEGKVTVLSAKRQAQGITHLYTDCSELIALVNLKTFRGDAAALTYIGRVQPNRPGSALGNPYKRAANEQPGATIKRYKIWLWEQMQSDTPAYQELRRLAGLVKQGTKITLACWCSPNPCHGDAVKSAILYLLRAGLV